MADFPLKMKKFSPVQGKFRRRPSRPSMHWPDVYGYALVIQICEIGKHLGGIIWMAVINSRFEMYLWGKFEFYRS